MRYLYQRGQLSKRTRRMHIDQHDPITGDVILKALCGEQRITFDTSINAPWSLGCGVCKRCESKLKQQVIDAGGFVARAVWDGAA